MNTFDDLMRKVSPENSEKLWEAVVTLANQIVTPYTGPEFVAISVAKVLNVMRGVDAFVWKHKTDRTWAVVVCYTNGFKDRYHAFTSYYDGYRSEWYFNQHGKSAFNDIFWECTHIPEDL